VHRRRSAAKRPLVVPTVLLASMDLSPSDDVSDRHLASGQFRDLAFALRHPPRAMLRYYIIDDVPS
jgi:hypothetical protein